MRSVLVILLLIVVPNIFATIRIARSTLPPRRRGLQITIVWLVPILGSIIGLLDTSGPKFQPKGSAPTPRRERAPDTIEAAGLSPFKLNEHFFDGHGFPILDWEALETWADAAATPESRQDAIELGRRAWLMHLRDCIGPYAQLVETETAWVVSSFEPAVANATARYVATARGRIARLLDGVAKFPERSRTIVVAFDNQDQYYRYITNYYPEEGEFAFSSGLFVKHGCPHFLMVLDDLSAMEPVIAHEMTHYALSHLELPLWLDEGIAVNTEHQVSVRYRNANRDIEVMNSHADFWTGERMQEFWSGASFTRTDDGNSLSYDLARNIVALIGREWGSFSRFVHGVKRDDAGAAAALAELDLDLGELAAAAIGLKPGKGWSPDPGTWPKVALR